MTLMDLLMIQETTLKINQNNERIITFLSYREEKIRRKVININAKVIPNP